MLYLELAKEIKSNVPEKIFQNLLKKFSKVLESVILKKLGKRNGLIDLVIVNDSRIKNLNKDFRDINKSTDVIAFAYLEVTNYKKEKGDIIVGDIFISLDTAKKQAKSHKHGLVKELEVLFTHGLLHLFGFDHKTDKEENEMEKWAKKILN